MNKFTRMDKLIKKKVIYISIVLFVLVMTNIALSYSYYLGKVVGNESNTTLLLTSFGLKVDYENNSDTIIADYIVPGWTTSKTFSLSTLINESDIVDLEKKLFYEIFMYVDQNDFPGELITYTLTGDSSNKIGNGEMIDNKNNIGIATGVNTEGISIGVGYFKLGSNKHDYTITFNYSDDAIFTDRKFGIHIGAKVVEHAILNLDLDGGTIEGKTTRFASKNGKVYLEKPVKIDYVFAGWEIVDGDGEVAGNEVTVNSDSVTVKAKWVVGDGSVLLFLDLNGGDTTDERYISIPSNSTVELTVPTREYYDFNGWQLITDSNATIEGNNITVQDTDVIIQAQWVFAKVKLTIDVNGGTTTQDVVSSVTMNSPATLIEPTKTGYSFAGWEITSGTAVLNGNTINISTTDVTVRAKWAIKSYTVSFNSNGGTSVSNQTVQYGSTATQPSNPTRTGYTFQGWTLNGNAFSFGTPITQNITLVASWRINTYTVTFNSNGGSSVANQTVNHGSTAKAPTNPTKSGYIFNGWTLNGSAFNFSTAITSNITLVANWKSVIPTFTYLKSDGKAASYLVVNDGGNNWRIKFLESGTLKFTYIGNASSGINVFLVGGGGAGGSGGLWHGATGGGGGYTATHSKSVQVGNTYNIVIGSG